MFDGYHPVEHGSFRKFIAIGSVLASQLSILSIKRNTNKAGYVNRSVKTKGKQWHVAS